MKAFVGPGAIHQDLGQRCDGFHNYVITGYLAGKVNEGRNW